MRILSLIILFLYSQVLWAQNTFYAQALSNIFSVEKNIPSVYIDSLYLPDILLQDSLFFIDNHTKVVARLQKTNINPYKNGKWETLSNGQSIWRCHIKVPYAKSIALEYSTFKIPKEGKLFIYPPSKEKILGAYTSRSNNKNDVFGTDFIDGNNLIIEYNAPINSKDSLKLNISGIINRYQKESTNTGFGTSTDCEVNINCEEGNEWGKEAQSIVKILIKSGDIYTYCSGVILNNTAHNCKPYTLTADHCGSNSDSSDRKLWRFYFNYESPDCNNPQKESNINYKSLIGCRLMAHGGNSGDSGSDFRLVKLIEDIPPEWNVYYAGWDIEKYDSINGGGVGIHHPNGDIKKISTYKRTVEEYDPYGNNLKEAFWEVFWTATKNGFGITEGGSSGSPLFSNLGLVIGTLSGGSSYCNENDKKMPDFYGKMSYHWASNGSDSTQQLKYWLNPTNENISYIQGSYYPCNDQKTMTFEKFTVFPNPTTGRLYIADTDMKNLTNAQVDIYNLSGILVKSFILSTKIDIQNIDISQLSSGMYILIIKSKKEVFTSKIILFQEK